jgi:hypothetical protein
VGVNVRRDDGRETPVKENDDDGWRSDGMVLWVGMRQNGDAIEWRVEVGLSKEGDQRL